MDSIMGDVSSSSSDDSLLDHIDSSDSDSDTSLDDQTSGATTATGGHQNILSNLASKYVNKQHVPYSSAVNSVIQELQIDSDSLSSDDSQPVSTTSQQGSSEQKAKVLSKSTNHQNIDSPRTKLRELRASVFGDDADISDNDSSSDEDSRKSQRSTTSNHSLRRRKSPLLANSPVPVFSSDESSDEEDTKNSSGKPLDNQQVQNPSENTRSSLSPPPVRSAFPLSSSDSSDNDDNDGAKSGDEGQDGSPSGEEDKDKTLDSSNEAAAISSDESAYTPDDVPASQNESASSQDDSVSSFAEGHDKFSAMKAYIQSKNASSSQEPTEQTQNTDEPSQADKPEGSSTAVSGEAGTSKETRSSESGDDDVVFVSRYDPNKDAPLVVLSDTDSDPDVVVVRTEMRKKHRGIGKSSSRSSSDTVKAESQISENATTQTQTRNDSSSGYDPILGTNNADRNNDLTTISPTNSLVYPNILPSDNCLCDVFGAGAFGCKTHSSTGKSNSLTQSFDAILDRVGKSNASDPSPTCNSIATEDSNSALGSHSKSPVDAIGMESSSLDAADRVSGDKLAVEKLRAAAERAQQRPSPILDMPTDFSSYVDPSGISSSNDQSISAMPGDFQVPTTVRQSRTMSVDTTVPVASTNTRQELSRSQSMPGTSSLEQLSNKRRKPPTESPLLKKRNYLQDKYKRLTKLVNMCMVCIEETQPQHLAYCMGEHSWCKPCLEKHVKDLLSNEKGSLRCGIEGCDSFFSKVQLKNQLPAMIVDVLEAKMDKETVSQVDQEMGEPDELMQLVASLQPPEEIMDENDSRTNSQGLPAKWEPMDEDQTLILCEVKAGTLEDLNIRTSFYESMSFPRAKIVKITRIQNPTLWQFYSVKKKHMIKQLGEDNLNERQLYHGTKADVTDAICRNNFDWRVCGMNGTAYGQGSYFAREACYSHRYTDHHQSLGGPPRVGHVPPWLMPPGALGHRRTARNPAKLQQSIYSTLQSLTSMQSSLSGMSSARRLQGLFVFPPTSQGHNATNQSLAGSTSGTSTTGTNTTNQNYGAVVGSSNSINQPSSSIQGAANDPMNPIPGAHRLGCRFSQAGSAFTLLQNTQKKPKPIPKNLVSYAPGFVPRDPRTGLPASSQPLPSSSANPTAPAQSGATGGNQYKPLLPGIPVSPFGAYGLQPPPPPSIQVPLPAPAPNPVIKTEQVDPPAEKTHMMFFARVLCGNSAMGASSYRKPPPVNPDVPYGACYDSCVDNDLSPNIYVIFDNAQCYPEYLIEYSNKPII